MSVIHSRPQQWEDWLAVSTDGFAAMNAGRPPAHLVKELVQNALDALDTRAGAGEVSLSASPVSRPHGLLITCRDSGCGMSDLARVRTVFDTSKTDSHLQRGRMGRGFKEMLCLARQAAVTSGNRRIRFIRDGDKRRCRTEPALQVLQGTLVEMEMPWSSEVIAELVAYFSNLLPPANVRFIVNGAAVPSRPAEHLIHALLPTELYDQGRWIRPLRRTGVELVAVGAGTGAGAGQEPMVYELGIPVCPVEWTAGYHANVLQRVPMNPGRDAVASGYLLKLHKSCLPALLEEMDDESVRQDWVGLAAGQCRSEVQRRVIRLGFGRNIARSVPKMGSRQFDEDARDLGVSVVDIRQTSGGFRRMLQDHVPTTRQVVDQHDRELLTAAAGGGFSPAAVYKSQDDSSRRQRQWIEDAGGRQRVELVMEFAHWFCQQLLNGYPDSSVCSITLAPLRAVNAVAAWSTRDVLTLGIDTQWLWQDPLGADTLATLIHEAAHHLNAHHGRDFHRELEALAGRAARLMLDRAQFVSQRYASFLS